MAGPQGTMENRVDQLERQVRALTDQLRKPPQDRGWVAPLKNVRLGKTVDPGSPNTYPTAASRTYPFVFVDGTFTDTSVNTTDATYTERMNVTKALLAYSPDENETLLPENTIIAVLEQNGKYWILQAWAACPEE